MNQKSNNLKFKEHVKVDSNNKSPNHQNQRYNAKLIIMDKYNVSSEDADIILAKIEKKARSKYNYKNKSSKFINDKTSNSSSKQVLRANNTININNSQNMDGYNHSSNNRQSNVGLGNGKASKTKLDFSESQINVKTHNRNRKSTYLDKQNNDKSSSNAQINNLKSSNQEFSSQKLKSEKNVESILGDIIADYDKQISIDVNHVDLTFEVQNEKVETLKESFIRFFKRNKAKKIKIHALKDISFKIYKGEKVGIIGYNGAGKSTLLNVITGIYRPDKGDVTTYGKISPLLSLGAGFDSNFSGRRNIILNGAVLGHNKKYLESKIDEIIEFSELGEFIDIPIKNYSSGMLAKLGFSIATAVEPDILIIDEVLGVGDVNFQKKSSDKIKSLMDGGTTVLLVSHSIPQVRRLCDKAIWIDNGNLREMGEVNKVCDNYIKDSEKASKEQLANIKLVK